MIFAMRQEVSTTDGVVNAMCHVVSDFHDEAGKVLVDFIQTVSCGADVTYRNQPTTDTEKDFERDRVWFRGYVRFYFIVSVGL